MRVLKGLVLSACLVLFVPASARANEFRGILRNNSGVKYFAEKRADKAMEEFTGALGDLPFSGAVHFNMGNAFLARRDLEKALSEYELALTSATGDSKEDRETRFRALFNSAVIRTEMNQIEEALGLYQKALEIYPDSIETKTNMELLAQQAQGGGQGEQEQKDKDQEGNNQQQENKENEGQDNKQKQEPQKFDNPRATPRPFKSSELSPDDAKRILEEMKRQEEQIRAKMQKERVKDRPPEKDW